LYGERCLTIPLQALFHGDFHEETDCPAVCRPDSRIARVRPAATPPNLQAGKEYKAINPPLPAAKDKIEVLEFFSYGCNHCSDFHPTGQPVGRQTWRRMSASAGFR
jgi:hypothetical protein